MKCMPIWIFWIMFNMVCGMGNSTSNLHLCFVALSHLSNMHTLLAVYVNLNEVSIHGLPTSPCDSYKTYGRDGEKEKKRNLEWDFNAQHHWCSFESASFDLSASIRAMCDAVMCVCCIIPCIILQEIRTYKC